jgi:rubrerythrin
MGGVDKRKNLENEKSCGVKECNNKYICEACGATVLKADHNCPTCKREINWGRVITELKRNLGGF